MTIPGSTDSFFLLYFDSKNEFLAFFDLNPFWNGNLIDKITKVADDMYYWHNHKKLAQVHQSFFFYYLKRLKSPTPDFSRKKQENKNQHNTLSQVALCGRPDKMELAMFPTSTAHSMILLKNYTAS